MRTRNIYTTERAEPFRVSRSKIELFLQCPRCFYLDRRLGIERPDGPPFTLNSAVDVLLKREFDTYRIKGEPHPFMVEKGIDAVPMRHPELEEWRNNFKGVTALHEPTSLLICGAVDDVWVDREGSLMVVDYKATSTQQEVSLEGKWKDAYKRQMEIYQWLLRRNGFRVLNTGYFVYVNAHKRQDSFDKHLHFDMHLLPYTGSDDWVEEAIIELHRCLESSSVPAANAGCEFCVYRKEAQDCGC